MYTYSVISQRVNSGHYVMLIHTSTTQAFTKYQTTLPFVNDKQRMKHTGIEVLRYIAY